MKNIVLITIIWLLSNNLIAQNSVNIIGGGRSTEPSPAGLFAKNAEVCYDFPRTSYLASLIISHSDIKENGNVTQTAVFYQLSLHKLSVPKAIIAIGMDGVDCKFTAIDSKGFFMSNYTLRENLARVKV
ncbi:MAG: hypothetical protein II939_00860, partial [Bacteroidales bacterium]|nr:hypothetical protein [Bacteroidales bacterium]